VPPTTYVIMGVAGSGKTLIGSALARELGATFVEGDEYHPPENVARMASGIPLTDDDRRDWLQALAARIREAATDHTSLVLSCSALKRAYRDVLRGGGPVQFVFLRGSRELIAQRLADRRGHFMPLTLLDSQFAALEEPGPDERAWVCDVDATPDAIVAAIARRAAAA
jgi:gluconokinase